MMSGCLVVSLEGGHIKSNAFCNWKINFFAASLSSLNLVLKGSGLC